ncbi:PaREP1 family protein [Pyrodictium abyssi]|uniref:PaREP1 family protein n=1 Tax=Pyrodictium abyssi TaxID=54256 RepID=A0ABM8IY64_9CREN|nr:PaREP1 family protein [Pyrodictium abyssi]
MSAAKALEKPLPRPRRGLVGYAAARALEALLEALLALRFLGEGFTRSAAGKALQAWRALTGALPALERDRVAEKLENEEQRRWLLEKAIPRAPTGRLKALSQLLDEVGYRDYTHYTSTALSLHDYQLHGPDPSGELSKYPGEEEARKDIVYLVQTVARVIGSKARQSLTEKGAWAPEHEEALQRLAREIESLGDGA